MIGKTSFNYSASLMNPGNKDISLQSIVLSLLFCMIVFNAKSASAQGSAGGKSNPKTQATTKSNEAKAAAEAIDDNSDDSEDIVKSKEERKKEASSSAVAEIGNKTNSSKVNSGEEADDSDTDDTVTAEGDDKGAIKAEAVGEFSEKISEPKSQIDEAQDGDEQANGKEFVAEQEETNEKESMPEEEAKKVVEEPPGPSEPTAVTKQPSKPIVDPAPEPVVEKETQGNFVEVIPREKNVEVQPRKKYTNYRERRTTNGFLFSVNAENLYFPDYASILDDELYENLFGQEDLTLAQVQVSYKLNFFLGSFVTGVGFGYGTLIDDRSGIERSLSIGKKSAHGQWLLDSLMKEPFFVPYIGAEYWQMELTEKNATSGLQTTYTTGNGTSLTAGFLVQLNWIEPETSRDAYLNHGLENTYLDVFWTQYQSTDEELDPNFENDFNFGVGLKMEF